MKTSEYLKAARQLITPVENWTQGALAKSNRGWEIDPLHDDAVCFCSIGAGYKVGAITKENSNSVTPFRKYLADVIGGRPIVIYNDRRSHKDVLTMFDEAIKLAEEAGE